MEESGLHHVSAGLPLGKNPNTPRIGGWVGPGVSLDVLAKGIKSLVRTEFKHGTVQPLAQLLNNNSNNNNNKTIFCSLHVELGVCDL
jgi:hypothetical protein